MTQSAQEWSKYLNQIQSKEEFQNLNWEGNFFEYLDLVKKDPLISRNAFQRMYDMILTWGTENFIEYKKEITRYKFFDDPIDQGKDAVFGLDVQLMKLVNFFKSAAYGYGTEKRVLLLHGPVRQLANGLRSVAHDVLQYVANRSGRALERGDHVGDVLRGEMLQAALFGVLLHSLERGVDGAAFRVAGDHDQLGA
jgi:serine protein kinase